MQQGIVDASEAPLCDTKNPVEELQLRRSEVNNYEQSKVEVKKSREEKIESRRIHPGKRSYPPLCNDILESQRRSHRIQYPNRGR